eukprot:SAG22_NODE_7575_length_727_cov_1.380573_1_plen_43_part_10
MFYPYAMSYTACPLAGEPGTWTATGRRLCGAARSPHSHLYLLP